MITVAIMVAALVMQTSEPARTSLPAANGDDIVVLAHRLRKIRWEYEAKGGVLSKCEIKRTSGSAIVDNLVCKASAECAAELPDLGDRELVPCIRERVAHLYAGR